MYVRINVSVCMLLLMLCVILHAKVPEWVSCLCIRRINEGPTVKQAI